MGRETKEQVSQVPSGDAADAGKHRGLGGAGPLLCAPPRGGSGEVASSQTEGPGPRGTRPR